MSLFSKKSKNITNKSYSWIILIVVLIVVLVVVLKKKEDEKNEVIDSSKCNDKCFIL